MRQRELLRLNTIPPPAASFLLGSSRSRSPRPDPNRLRILMLALIERTPEEKKRHAAAPAKLAMPIYCAYATPSTLH
jgi:hypothetical protein